jgi:hypothetical protein
VRGIKSTAAIVLVVGLSVGTVAGVAAQDEEANSFTVTIGEPAGYTDMGDDGLLLFDTPVEASDPRATGTMQNLTNEGGLVREVNPLLVRREGLRLANDGGSWVGHGTSVAIYGDDGIPTAGHIIELVGEGGYDGLSMFVISQPVDPWLGIIVPTDTLPTQPEAPAAE